MAAGHDCKSGSWTLSKLNLNNFVQINPFNAKGQDTLFKVRLSDQMTSRLADHFGRRLVELNLYLQRANGWQLVIGVAVLIRM